MIDLICILIETLRVTHPEYDDETVEFLTTLSLRQYVRMGEN